MVGGGGGGGGGRKALARGAGVRLVSTLSRGGGVLPRGNGWGSKPPLAMVPAVPLRAAFREPFKALKGGSRTAVSSSDGSVSSTRLKKYSSTSG